jgi:hypothetical protein
MMRLPLISLDLPLLIGAAAAAMLSICSASAASGQATNASAAAAPVGTSTNLGCIQVTPTLARITVGQTPGTKLRLEIGRATGCNIDEKLGTWELFINVLDARGGVVDTGSEYIEPGSCPALSAHLNQLPAPRPWNPQWWAEPVTGMTVGPFLIENPAGIFALQSEHDRHATERWLRGTLAAVRNCWSVANSGDPTHPLADRFYAAVGL